MEFLLGMLLASGSRKCRCDEHLTPEQRAQRDRHDFAGFAVTLCMLAGLFLFFMWVFAGGGGPINSMRQIGNFQEGLTAWAWNSILPMTIGCTCLWVALSTIATVSPGFQILASLAIRMPLIPAMFIASDYIVKGMV